MSQSKEAIARRLLDTAQMATQYPEWLRREMEEAAAALIGAANEIERLRAAINKTIEENLRLADGDVCTLIHLKNALQPND